MLTTSLQRTVPETPAPSELRAATLAGCELDGVLYVLGGSPAQFLAYDTSRDQWDTSLPQHPLGSQAASMAAHGGQIWVCGGKSVRLRRWSTLSPTVLYIVYLSKSTRLLVHRWRDCVRGAQSRRQGREAAVLSICAFLLPQRAAMGRTAALAIRAELGWGVLLGWQAVASWRSTS
jgi:hypothetical protein